MMELKITPSVQTIVKPTALSPVANTDAKLLIYRLFQKGRVLAQDDHEDRCHLGLDKDTPNLRPVTPRPSPTAKIVALPRVGGLHHRYEWRDAA